jgi:hypothetical protein
VNECERMGCASRRLLSERYSAVRGIDDWVALITRLGSPQSRE